LGKRAFFDFFLDFAVNSILIMALIKKALRLGYPVAFRFLICPERKEVIQAGHRGVRSTAHENEW
jgi:hypothetical protein